MCEDVCVCVRVCCYVLLFLCATMCYHELISKTMCYYELVCVTICNYVLLCVTLCCHVCDIWVCVLYV